jgi:hypothetical protein
MYVTHEEEYKGYNIKIVQDDDSSNSPMDWDLLGTHAYWHRRYSLGNIETKHDPKEWIVRQLESDYGAEIEKSQEYQKYSKEEYNGDYCMDDYLEDLNMDKLLDIFEKYNLIIPVYAYEHSGITISAGGKRMGWDSWDSGRLGFVFVSHKKILDEYGGKRITKKLLDRAEKCLLAEVEEYDDYLTGNVWGYVIEGNGERESCWGYIGDYKYCLEEARSVIGGMIAHNEKQEVLFNACMSL